MVSAYICYDLPGQSVILWSNVTRVAAGGLRSYQPHLSCTHLVNRPILLPVHTTHVAVHVIGLDTGIISRILESQLVFS